MQFSIKGGSSACAACLNGPGIHRVYDRFERPIPAVPALDLPEITGVFVYLCDACYAKRNANIAHNGEAKNG